MYVSSDPISLKFDSMAAESPAKFHLTRFSGWYLDILPINMIEAMDFSPIVNEVILKDMGKLNII